jgi:hypothetical protein
VAPVRRQFGGLPQAPPLLRPLPSHGVDQRREQSAIYESRHGDVMGRWQRVSDDLFAIDKALQLMTDGILAAATKAVREVIWYRS